MNAEFRRVKEIFLAAVEKPDAAERDAYLREACGQDEELRRQVDALLGKHAQAGSFLEPAVPSPGATVEEPSISEAAGAIIGPYKLLQQIGEGGMGTVFMAEQTHPVHRKVALKLIKPGMDSRQVVARFEAERQALAMMDHVNIARVFDGGTTENGRPYFVMELVHGVPITKYCDDNHLTPRERLDLFVPVCQAIQHAHQKGIIHRDVKPSNVMVTLYDGKPVPKVIDFGVAKATEQKLTERTLFTQYGTMVGTLEYMSPEQAEMNALGVDTRSDIYSLGVLLYELLTGSTPLSRQRMKEAAYAEILRMIKEEEPPRPSTRLSDSGEALASISANRHTEPAKLSKLVRGELDWIVMKCLEKDRGRRYETANAFAADVQRYLNDETVQACPPSAWYRFRKFQRRNRVALLTASLVTFALVLGTAISTWQAIRATAAEHQAEENLANARAAVDQMLTRVSADRLKNVPQAYPVRHGLLEDALKFYDGFLRQRPDDPHLRLKKTQILQSLGHLQWRMSQLAEADRSTRHALEIAKTLVADHPTRVEYREALAGSHESLARNLVWGKQTEECEAQYRRALVLWTGLAGEVPGNPLFRDRVARCELGLARVLRRVGRPAGLDEAEALVGRAIAADRVLANQSPADHAHWLNLVDDALVLAELHESRGKLEKAEEGLRLSLPDAEKLGTQFAEQEQCRKMYAKYLLQRGRILSRLGRQQEAVELALKALEIREQLVDDFPEIQGYQTWLATILIRHVGPALGATRPRQAEEAFRRALAILEHLAKGESMDPSDLRRRMIDCRKHLAALLFATDRRTEAEALWRQARTDAEELIRADPRKGHLLDALLRVWPDAPAADAERVYRAALPLSDWLVEQDPSNRQHRLNANGHRRKLALLLITSGRAEEGRSVWGPAMHFYDQRAAKHPDQPHYGCELVGAQLDLAEQLRIQRRPKEAEQVFQQALRTGQKLAAEFPKQVDCRRQLARGQSKLADLLTAGGRGKEAEPLRGQALDLWKVLAAESPKEPENWLEVGILNIQQAHWDEALACLSTALELKPDASLARYHRGYVYARLGRWDEALAELTKSLALSPKFWWSWYRRGQAHAARMEWAKAAADYARAIELGAADPWVWVDKAAAHARLAEPEQAVAGLRQAIARGFRDAEHLKNRDDLADLRPREDFKALLAELDAKKQ